MTHIITFFPISIYNDIDEKYLPETRKMFIDYRDFLISSGEDNKLKTTLKSYFNKNLDNGVSEKIITKHSNFIDFIKKSAENYLQLNGLVLDGNVEVTKIWLNDYLSESQSYDHAHSKSKISGCYYVDLPKFENHYLRIKNPVDEHHNLFSDPKIYVEKHTDLNCQYAFYKPVEGEILLWNSSIVHGSPRVVHEELRRNIAFDIEFS
jgi:uncharacterized protein (TIGR02466 family)